MYDRSSKFNEDIAGGYRGNKGGGMRELEVTERVKRNKYVEKVERMLKKKISVKF